MVFYPTASSGDFGNTIVRWVNSDYGPVFENQGRFIRGALPFQQNDLLSSASALPGCSPPWNFSPLG
jgi:hypothetical protein